MPACPKMGIKKRDNMAYFYIAGPVVRQTFGQIEDLKFQELTGIYDRLLRHLQKSSFDVAIPKPDQYLDFVDPTIFRNEIIQRIQGAFAVITILTTESSSAGIEAQIASTLRKPQGLVVEDTNQVPRLLRSLPGVIAIATPNKVENLVNNMIGRIAYGSSSELT